MSLRITTGRSEGGIARHARPQNGGENNLWCADPVAAQLYHGALLMGVGNKFCMTRLGIVTVFRGWGANRTCRSSLPYNWRVGIERRSLDRGMRSIQAMNTGPALSTLCLITLTLR